jgi:cytochrome c553
MDNARVYRRDLILPVAAIVGVSLLLSGVAFRLARANPHQSPQAEASGKLHECASCHGQDGVSSAEIFPNLAGQQKEYIATQLTAFRDQTRRDRNAKTYMWGMAAGLSDATIQALAADYASKTPAVAVGGDKREIAAGKTIYENGVAAHGVPACASCHGPKGEGNAAFPALAGQHKEYLAVQLAALASGARDNAIMLPIAKGMTPKQINAVSAYLASW